MNEGHMMVASPTEGGPVQPGLIRMGVRPSIPVYLSQLWGRREFALLVPLGELRQRNMNTVLGSAWHVLNPLFQALIYYFLFGVVLDARGDIDNYAVWLIVGLITFTFTQKTVASASGIILQRVSMLRTLNFPAGILPISVTLGEMFAHGPALLVMLVITATAYAPGPAWLLLLPIVTLQTMFSLGLGLIVARLTVHFHDFSHLLGHLLKMWLLASGVMFSFENAPAGLVRDLLEANPAYVYIRLTRDALFDGRLDPNFFRPGLAWAFGTLLAGFLFFYRFEGRYSNAV
jgi:teichoic acid transport system permease protein